MTDTSGLAVQAVALRLLTDRVKERDNEVRAQLAATLKPGARWPAALADGTDVGVVTYTKGSRSRPVPRVVDERAFTEWVVANHPDEVVQQVRSSFRTALLDSLDGVVYPKTGEVIPGVEIGYTGGSTPHITVVPDKNGAAALIDAIRANQELALALETAPEEQP